MESRLGKSYGYGLNDFNRPNIAGPEIKLNMGIKRNSAGIRDEDDLLCPTPPEPQSYT